MPETRVSDNVVRMDNLFSIFREVEILMWQERRTFTWAQ